MAAIGGMPFSATFVENIHTDRWIKYSFAYLFLSVCFIFPPRPFVELGCTVEGLFGSWIGSEKDHFVHFHIRRTYCTVISHAILLLGYLGLTAHYFGNYILAHPDAVWHEGTVKMGLLYAGWWSALFFVALSVLIAESWRIQGWRRHPIVRALSGYDTPWQEKATSIAAEFRCVDITHFQLGTQGVVVTNSWIMCSSLYSVSFAHQSDVDLSIQGSQEVSTVESADADQILTIRVTSLRGKPFVIRLSSLHFEELQDKIMAPIRNMQDIAIKQSLGDLFLAALRSHVANNTPYALPPQQQLDRCVGCMNQSADVKVVTCMCRPMWCLECLGKWFASKQPQSRPEVWMNGEAACPTCRATFNVSDICTVATPAAEATAVDMSA